MSRNEHWRLGLDIVGTTALVIACAVLISHIMSVNASRAPVESTNPVNDVALESTAKEHVQGATTAPIAIIEFADFECPFCVQFASTTYPSIKRELIDTGKIQFMFRHYPLDAIHPQARKASTAVECAGQQRQYWEMHDRLFANPRQLGDENLVQHAGALKLNEQQFGACLAADATTVAQDEAEAERLGVTATPTFFLGRLKANGKIDIVKRIQGAVSYEVMKASVLELL